MNKLMSYLNTWLSDFYSDYEDFFSSVRLFFVGFLWLMCIVAAIIATSYWNAYVLPNLNTAGNQQTSNSIGGSDGVRSLSGSKAGY